MSTSKQCLIALGAFLSGCTVVRPAGEKPEEPIDFTTVDMGASGAPLVNGTATAPGTNDDFDLLFKRDDPLYVPDDSLFASDAIVCPKGNDGCEQKESEAMATDDLAGKPLPTALRVDANVLEAAVFIDGVRKARVGEPVDLNAGPVVIEVQAPGYRSFRSQVSLKEHETKQLTVVLLRE